MAVCRNCGAFLMPRKMMCTTCGDWSPNAEAATVGEPVKEDDFVDLTEVDATSIERIITAGPWDPCWGGGFVPSSITLLGGAPGAGKTTLLLQLAKAFAVITKRPTYYISAEQDKGDLALTVKRLELQLDKGMIRVLKKFGAGGSIDEGTLDKVPPGMIILDSVSALCGNDKHTQIAVAKRYKQYAVKYKAPTFLIAHMTKESDFAGLMALQHEVDTLVTIFPEEDGIRHMKAWKNRFGATHQEYKLIMTAHGFEAAPEPEKRKKGQGRLVGLPPPVGELMPRTAPSGDLKPVPDGPPPGAKLMTEEEARAMGLDLSGATPVDAPIVPETVQARFKRPPPIETVTMPDGQKLVRRKKVDKTQLKKPLTATVKEVAARAVKAKKSRASAVEGEALKRPRPPMPKTRDAKVKAERSTGKMGKKAKRKTKSEESRV